jgi:preprotein translocase subunit SecY
MSTFTDSYKVPELRKKMWFTFLILSVLALLSLVPVPGIDHAGASAAVMKWGDTGVLLDVMSFKALGNVSITSLGLYPFLIASIVMQIVTIAVPKLRAIAQTGDEGTKVIQKITRIAAVIADVVFAVLYCVGMRNHIWTSINYWVAICLAGLCLAAGAAFFGWCIELINNKGVGSGLIIVILACIIRDLPRHFADLYTRTSVLGVPAAAGITAGAAVVVIALLVFVVWFNLGGKKLHILFSKRTVGMKQYGMQNQSIPLRVAQAGTMPVIYSLTIMLLPAVIMCLVLPEGSTNIFLLGFINFKRSISFYIIYAAFISLFTYLFAMIQFNPFDLSNQIKQNGGYIQGLRPGKQTARYLMSLYKNFFIADTAFLVCVCLVPMLLDLIPAITGIWYLGIVVCLLGGGFVELNSVLENGIETEEEKNKIAVKDRKKNKYAK